MMKSSRVQIGISSCLLGNRVRYDGEHSHSEYIIDSFGCQFELIPFCPEVAIGLGVPRPPINLVQVDGAIRVRGVNDTEHDVTDALTNYTKDTLQEFNFLSGYIFKSKSPSCGLVDVNVYDSKTNRVVDVSAGQFAKTIVLQHPALPVTDELMLANKELRTLFISNVMNFHQKQTKN